MSENQANLTVSKELKNKIDDLCPQGLKLYNHYEKIFLQWLQWKKEKKTEVKKK